MSTRKSNFFQLYWSKLTQLYQNLSSACFQLLDQPKIKQYMDCWQPHYYLKLILLFLIGVFFPIQNPQWYQKINPGQPVTRDLPTPAVAISQSIIDCGQPLPYLSAAGIYLIDLNQNSLLYSQEPNHRFYPASTTKLVTALVAGEHFQPQDVITVPVQSAWGQVLGLQPGEQYWYKDLLYGLLVQSGNDAAETLAMSYHGGYDAFINRMNSIIKDLNLSDTHFVNPTGLDAWEHYSTPHDMAVISQKSLSDLYIAEAVSTKNYRLTDISGKRNIELTNINELLGEFDGMKGIKTGWTELAGECLVSYVEKDGFKYLSIVMFSGDRFGDTRRLLTWAQSNFEFIEF